MMNKLTIYAYADNEYTIFIPAYIYFALESNRESFVEINTPSSSCVYEQHKSSLTKIKNKFGDRFKIRDTSPNLSKDIIPNTIRFIDPPLYKSKYLYIGDIDIMICEDIVEAHALLIKRHELPFSNVIRNPEAPINQRRLTGLHFIETEKYLPLPDLSDLNLKIKNDEEVLYEIMSRKDLMVPATFRERPELGLHMSLSRDPFGRCTGPRQSNYKSTGLGWAGKEYHEKFFQISSNIDFLTILSVSDLRYKLLHLCAEALIKNEVNKIEEISLGYMIDRSRLIKHQEKSLKSALLDKNIEDFLSFPLRKEMNG